MTIKKIKVLNAYACIGGNRKLWQNVEVTAVEHTPWIAAIYQDLYPEDKVIIGDAHEYILHHHNEFDFVWGSPVCKSHSRTNYFIRESKGTLRYPDMALYQEILLLQAFHKGKFCIENVIPYYEPLVKAQVIGRHLLWANFNIPKIAINGSIGKMSGNKQTMNGKTQEYYQIQRLEKSTGYNLDKYGLSTQRKAELLRNCTNPELGNHVLECARGAFNNSSVLQIGLFGVAP